MRPRTQLTPTPSASRSGAPVELERHETPDPVRSNAVKSRFHCVQPTSSSGPGTIERASTPGGTPHSHHRSREPQAPHIFRRNPAPSPATLARLRVQGPRPSIDGGGGPRPPKIERAEVCAAVLAGVRRLARTGRRSRSRAASSRNSGALTCRDRVPPGEPPRRCTPRPRSAESCHRSDARGAASPAQAAELLPPRSRGRRASFVKHCA